MHISNILFWEYVGKTYSNEIKGTVYEYGSFDEMDMGDNDPVFKISKHTERYGIDWRAGPHVDIVSIAHEAELYKPANAILSASMMEHDPYYEQTFPHMVDHLKDGGFMALSWGAALNAPHCHDHSPLGEFHNLKAGIVIEILESLGMTINEFLYEGIRYDAPENFPDKDAGIDGMGEVGLIAFKGQIPAQYEEFYSIDGLLAEDRV